MNNASGINKALGLALSLCFILSISGCNDEDDKAQPKAHKPAVQEPVEKPAPAVQVRKESIELLPDNVYRRRVLNEFNQEIESHTTSPNGSESVFRRADGSIQESVSKDKNGVIKKRRVFGRDGKTVVAGLESRSDGNTLWTIEQDKDGSIRKTTYWYDGKKIFSVEVTRPNGQVELSYFRKGGTLWQKKFGAGSDTSKYSVEQYDSSGKLQFRVNQLPDGTTEVLRKTDKGELRLLYQVEKNASYGYVSWNPLGAEERDSNGKLLRKFSLDKYKQLNAIEIFNNDGTRTVQSSKYGWVDKEEVFDKDGNCVSSKEYKWNERPDSSIERSFLEKPSVEDPVYRWQNQENSPYYRYGDD